MRSRKKYVSHSQLRKYRECPERWSLHYRERLRPDDASIHFIYGTASHEVVQTFLRNHFEERSTPDLPGLLRKHMAAEFRADREDFEGPEFPISQEDMTYFLKRGSEILEFFKSRVGDFFDPSSEEIVGIEYRLDAPFKQNVHWIGYIDLLLKTNDGRYRIVDLKTSKKGWDRYKKRDNKVTDQLLFYKHFFHVQQDVPLDRIDVEYLIFSMEGTPTLEVFQPDDTDLDDALGVLDEFVSEAFTLDGSRYSQKDLPKQPGKWNCCFCPYSTDFGEPGYQVCDMKGRTYDDYPDSMEPYVPNRFLKKSS